MHIPDAYLSPATEAAGFGVMVPIWMVAAKKTSSQLTSRQAPLLSIGAAFCFAIQMFNIPAIGGTSAHALGAALLAILVGRWAAVLGMTLTLAIQALLFGDGGILSLGINCFDMAFVASFVGYGVYRLIAGRADFGSARGLIGAAIGAYLGTVTASLSAGILLGIQPLIAHDALGHALYCPFGLNISVPAMVMTHLLVAAPAEALITVAAVSYLWRSFPELLTARPARIGSPIRLTKRLAWVLVLTPIGLIAGGSAFGEWDASEIQKMVGYAPAGLAKAHEFIHPLLPDYGFSGSGGKLWEIAGYLVSAFVGSAVVAIFTRSILRRPKPELYAVQTPIHREPANNLPSWMTVKEPKRPALPTSKAPWFETTVLRMRGTIAKTVASEEVARSSGLLQSIHPTAKTIGFLSALIATGLAKTPADLTAILASTLIAAAFSNVPVKSLILRVASAVVFFGLIVAIPVTLSSVTSGPVAFSVAGIAFSAAGLRLASLILLRLAAGITLALLWNLTTPWHLMLKSFRSFGVPQAVLGTATLTYRYLFVMMETLGEMVEARTARQVGACDKRQAQTYAGTGAAVLFAKSLALTEETHLAMQARSFGEVVKTPKASSWRIADLATAMTGLAFFITVLIQGAAHVI